MPLFVKLTIQKEEEGMMGATQITYKELVEKAKRSETMHDLVEKVGIGERAVRRRFQRKRTSYMEVRTGKRHTPTSPCQGPSESKQRFLKDLRENDETAIRLNRQFICLRKILKKIVEEKKNGWEKGEGKLRKEIEEIEEIIEDW